MSILNFLISPVFLLETDGKCKQNAPICLFLPDLGNLLQYTQNISPFVHFPLTIVGF
jgi:hypothetical protein